MSHQSFLAELGRRLRAGRQKRGLSVAALAEQAELSRRYVTETEAGRANPSILVLAKLASALGLALPTLLDIPLRARALERIALVGLRGAGKSTIGRQLAQVLEAPFVELDARVEEVAGIELGEIFSVHGEDSFHRFEREALEQVLAEAERQVVAVGGSIVSSPENFQRLRQTCRTIWLRADAEDHFGRVLAQGDARPMRNRPRAMEELRGLLAEREPLYAKCEFSVDTSEKSEAEVLTEAARWCQSE